MTRAFTPMAGIRRLTGTDLGSGAGPAGGRARAPVAPVPAAGPGGPRRGGRGRRLRRRRPAVQLRVDPDDEQPGADEAYREP